MEPQIIIQILHVINYGEPGGSGAPNIIIKIIRIILHDPGGVTD